MRRECSQPRAHPASALSSGCYTRRDAGQPGSRAQAQAHRHPHRRRRRAGLERGDPGGRSSRRPTSDCEVIGLEDSFDGLIEPDRWRRLTPRDVTGILRIGGTILGTANRGNPFAYQIETTAGCATTSARCVEMYHQLTLDALIVIGGDGTLASPTSSTSSGMPIVGVPKTIDNDIVETTNTFGFDTAVSFATDAIDRLHTTAEAHHRVMVVEVMGRYAGWIALYAGVAGGADVILIPEIPFDMEKVAERDPRARRLRRPLQHRRRRRGREADRRQGVAAQGGRRRLRRASRRGRGAGRRRRWSR